MTTIRPEDEYRALLRDLSAIYEAQQDVFVPSAQADQRRIEAYWKMGRRIVDVVQNGKERGAYGKKVMRQLSVDMTQKYGRGFQTRTVQYMRRFALIYSEDAISLGLSWSHYRALLTIDDDSLRRTLEQRALAMKLSKEQLLSLVNNELRQREGAGGFPLEARNATPGIYKVVFDITTGKPLLDLGFNVTRELPIKGVRDLQDGEFVTFPGNDRFKRAACEPGARYCYPGEVLKVIDGDTVKMRIALGFGTRIDETMRLRGVDAAEIDTDEGKKAHFALSRLLKGAKQITVLTYSHDRYGRYIADLIVDGKYINKALVESGAARFLKM